MPRSNAADHPWHCGLWFSFAAVSGLNFWGGPSYLRGRGYEWVENHGRVKRRANPGYPNEWFVRREPYPMLANSPVFRKEYQLEPGARLSLGYSVHLQDH